MAGRAVGIPPIPDDQLWRVRRRQGGRFTTCLTDGALEETLHRLDQRPTEEAVRRLSDTMVTLDAD